MAESWFRVAYALRPKNKNRFISESLVNRCKARGIDLIEVDDEKSLVDQGPFDCLFHKLSGENWRTQLTTFSAKFPRTPIIDPLEHIVKLHNRVSMLDAVSDLKFDGEEIVGVPNQITIEDNAAISDIRFKFPAIAKSTLSSGSDGSHEVFLVLNSDGLNRLKPPIVLQEFVNHGGVMFKVYVIGDFVQCVKRKSLPDVPEYSPGRAEDDVLSFSRVSYFSMDGEMINDGVKGTEMPPSSLVRDMAKGLREATKLNLFNFDVIRDAKDERRYLIVDINYFPGFAKMPSYEQPFVDFLCDVLSASMKPATYSEQCRVKG